MQMEAEASQVKKEIIMENLSLTNCSSPNTTSPVQIQSSQATPSPETPLNRTTGKISFCILQLRNYIKNYIYRLTLEIVLNGTFYFSV